MKMKELEEQAKKELQEKNIASKKDLLKERLQELADAKTVLTQFEEQYQTLLDSDV